MRRLICHLVLLLCGAAQTQAEGLRVTTWNLNWFPSGSPDLAIPAVEAQRISEVASVLRGLSPDVIVLQEVRDWDTCEQLAQCLGGDAYRVLICSSFKDGQNNVPGKRQIALLSRFPAESSWSQEWQVQGAQKPPGGYVFAAVRAGGAIVGIFGVHLKNNLVQGNPEREAQFNIFKRE